MSVADGDRQFCLILKRVFCKGSSRCNQWHRRFEKTWKRFRTVREDDRLAGANTFSSEIYTQRERGVELVGEEELKLNVTSFSQRNRPVRTWFACGRRKEKKKTKLPQCNRNFPARFLLILLQKLFMGLSMTFFLYGPILIYTMSARRLRIYRCVLSYWEQGVIALASRAVIIKRNTN